MLITIKSTLAYVLCLSAALEASWTADTVFVVIVSTDKVGPHKKPAKKHVICQTLRKVTVWQQKIPIEANGTDSSTSTKATTSAGTSVEAAACEIQIQNPESITSHLVN